MELESPENWWYGEYSVTFIAEYDKKYLVNNELLAVGDPAYKLSTDEEWSIVKWRNWGSLSPFHLPAEALYQ